MRDYFRQLSFEKQPDHIGLAYDVWAPIDTKEGDNKSKIPDDKRADWLNKLSKTTISEDYKKVFYPRWTASLGWDDTLCREVTFASRLLVGHGHASPTEVGLTVHQTWGVPVIPGSALKGILSHYLETVYGPEIDSDDPNKIPDHPMDPSFSEETKSRARFQGPVWKGSRVAHGPGIIHRALFGAPAAESDKDFPEAGETQGCVVFHDALYVPNSVSNDQPYVPDTLTVHQSLYYRGEGATLPNDYDDPNPVQFLTVRPGTRLLLALSGPKAWTDFAMAHLVDALTDWGVGGKTSAGYGRIEESTESNQSPCRKIIPKSYTLKEFDLWLKDKSLNFETQRQRLEAIENDWLEKLRALPSEEQNEAIRLLKRVITSKKLIKKGIPELLIQIQKKA